MTSSDILKAENILDTAKKLFDCPLCGEFLTEASQGQCGHAFCSRCIKKLGNCTECEAKISKRNVIQRKDVHLLFDTLEEVYSCFKKELVQSKCPRGRLLDIGKTVKSYGKEGNGNGIGSGAFDNLRQKFPEESDPYHFEPSQTEYPKKKSKRSRISDRQKQKKKEIEHVRILEKSLVSANNQPPPPSQEKEIEKEDIEIEINERDDNIGIEENHFEKENGSNILSVMNRPGDEFQSGSESMDIDFLTYAVPETPEKVVILPPLQEEPEPKRKEFVEQFDEQEFAGSAVVHNLEDSEIIEISQVPSFATTPDFLNSQGRNKIGDEMSKGGTNEEFPLDLSIGEPNSRDVRKHYRNVFKFDLGVNVLLDLSMKSSVNGRGKEEEMEGMELQANRPVIKNLTPETSDTPENSETRASQSNQWQSVQKGDMSVPIFDSDVLGQDSGTMFSISRVEGSPKKGSDNAIGSTRDLADDGNGKKKNLFGDRSVKPSKKRIRTGLESDEISSNRSSSEKRLKNDTTFLEVDINSEVPAASLTTNTRNGNSKQNSLSRGKQTRTPMARFASVDMFGSERLSQSKSQERTSSNERSVRDSNEALPKSPKSVLTPVNSDGSSVSISLGKNQLEAEIPPVFTIPDTPKKVISEERLEPKFLQPSSPKPKVLNRKFVFCPTRLSRPQLGMLQKLSAMCNGRIVKNYSDEVTHLILNLESDRVPQTMKYLFAIAGQKWIVVFEWVLESLKQDSLLNEEAYETSNSNFPQCDPGVRKSRLATTPLFKDFNFFIAGDMRSSGTSINDCKSILEHMGANIILDVGNAEYESVIIIGDPLDRGVDYQTWFESNGWLTISWEWILDCLLSYSLVRFSQSHLLTNVAGKKFRQAQLPPALLKSLQV